MKPITASGSVARRTGHQAVEFLHSRTSLLTCVVDDIRQLRAESDAIVNVVIDRLSRGIPGGIPCEFRLGGFLRLAFATTDRTFTSEECQGFKLSVSRISGAANDSHVLHIVLQLPRERFGRDHDARWQTLQVKVRGEEIPEESSPDLADFDLRGLDLALNWPLANLRGANLAHANLENAKLGSADFTGSNLDNAQFESCQLTGCDFSGAWMAGARLTGCDLLGADFTGSSLEQATLKGCWMSPATKLPPGVDHPRNLMQAADVLKGPGEILVVMDDAPPFVKQFTELIESRHGVSVFKASKRPGTNADGRVQLQWTRDYWFKCRADRPEKGFRLLAAPGDPSTLARGGANMFRHPYHSHHHMAHRFTAEKIGLEAKIHDLSQLHATVNGADVALGIGAPGAVEHAEKHFVPGGNLIMLDEECFPGGLCIVGNDSLAYQLPEFSEEELPPDQLRKAKESFPAYPLSPVFQAGLSRARATAESELREVLGVGKVIIVPQVFYHIDLLAMYFGRNVIGLHSFKETVKFLEENHLDLIGEMGASKFLELLKSSQEFAARYNGHIDTFASKLRDQKVTVIEMCAMLFTKIDLARPQGLYSIFPNGVAFDPGANERLVFYTTAAPRARAHMAHFSVTCERHDIDVEFVEGVPGDDPVRSVEARQGGLRCSTAFNLVGQLNHPQQG